MNDVHTLLVKHLGRVEYEPTWRAMQQFTESREQGSTSEAWIVEHPPVFTQGQAGKPEHLLAVNEIPVVQSDRGGQVTYHGPGQVVIYLLLNLRDTGMGIRGLVTAIEDSIIAMLAEHNIDAASRRDAPGVYVDEAKIAALGLRVKRGFTYHGLSFNLDMDLSPFQQINPCGYQGLAVTQGSELGLSLSFEQVANAILEELCSRIHHQAKVVE
ncbi:MAG: lipoyl(octanoyl) transferase LipB [Sedimenticolaceae bacterium]